jgi:hypothetical protein
MTHDDLDNPTVTEEEEALTAEYKKTSIDVLAPGKTHKPHRTPFIAHLGGRYPNLYKTVHLQKYTEVVKSVFLALKMDPKKQPGYCALLDLRQQIEERSSSISAERAKQIVEISRTAYPTPRPHGIFANLIPFRRKEE